MLLARTRIRSRALAVLSAAALALAACGGDDASDTTDTTETETSEEAPDTDADTDADDASDDGEEDGGEDDAGDDGEDTDDASGETLAVTGLDDLVWDVEELSASPGTIEFELTCESAMHNLVIEETDEMVAECGPDETVSGSVELDEGTYTYICTIPGHGDMRGTLTVG